MTKNDHYSLLDGARGIAALAVLFYHINIFLLPHFTHPFAEGFLKRSFLAVDLFFLMSGLVIARAYEAKLLAQTMSFPKFFKVRLIRLWPLYVLGTLLGLGYACIKMHLQPELAMRPGDTWISFALNLFFIPDLRAGQVFFPLNSPAWTLCLEWAVNLVYAAMVVHLTTRRLALVVALAALGLVRVALYEPSLDLGWGSAGALGGMCRILFAFPLGILIYRWLRGVTFTLPAWLAPPLLAGLTLMLLTPFGAPSMYYDLFCVFILIPCFVVLACLTRTPGALVRPCAWLGTVSYALYVLHEPLLFWLAGAYKLLTHRILDMDANTSAPILIAVMLAVAFAAALVDARLRERLRRRWRAG